MKESNRHILKSILSDPKLKRELGIRTIIATQAREGVITSRLQAERAYDKIQSERREKCAKHT